MKFSTPVCIAAVCATLALTGCVVAPVGYEPAYGGGQPYGGPAFAVPTGVVYVAPTYAMPGSGYAWRYHSRYGWGWQHPSRGWHRGWR